MSGFQIHIEEIEIVGRQCAGDIGISRALVGFRDRKDRSGDSDRIPDGVAGNAPYERLGDGTVRQGIVDKAALIGSGAALFQQVHERGSLRVVFGGKTDFGVCQTDSEITFQKI